MVFVLKSSNGQPVNGNDEALNAKISALSTANGVFLLLVIGACLSQQNWILFSQKSRCLYDFQTVSDASRGLQGSLRLLFRTLRCGHHLRNVPLWLSRRGPGFNDNGERVCHHFRGGTIVKIGVKIGAVATCLAVAMDPFAQKLISFDQREDFSEASIPYASRYSRGIKLTGLSGVSVTEDGRVDLRGPDVYANADFDMQAAIAFGFSADAEAIQQQTPFSCQGSQCVFEDWESLSVCSMCSNITDHLETNTLGNGGLYNDLKFDQSYAQARRNSTEYSLPNGLFLNNIDDEYGPSQSMVYMTMSGTPDPNSTVAMRHIDTLIWAQTVIKVATKPNPNSHDTWPSFGVSASECALYYCVRRYGNAKYNNSQISFTSKKREDVERDPESWASLDSLLQASDGVSDKVLESLAYHPHDSFISRTDLRLGSADGTTAWNVSDAAVYGISYYMQTFFASCLNRENCTQAVEDWVIPNGFYLSASSSGGRQREDYRPSTAKVLWESDDIEPIFKNVAASMSNALRRGADGEVEGKGTVLSSTTVYKVVWPWMTLHCVQEIITLFILVSTICSTHRRSNIIDVWKSSELAVFSKGATMSTILGGLHTKHELEEKAKKTKVDLFKTLKEAGPNASDNLLPTDQDTPGDES
ncbi:hypothetical protein FCOIX_11682 [Fusarium coicis]|nr:hypothetical protein FCOIX_11682 [Fusarium coicis]